MIQICTAEDGQVFQANASLRDIERIGSLEQFLHQEIGIDQDAALVYLSDGRRLTNTNIRELAGAQGQTIFVFNKYYLDYDLEEVLRELRVEAPLQLPMEDVVSATPPLRHSQAAATCVRNAHIHNDHVKHLFASLQYQHEAIRIASSSLDFNVLAIVDTFDGMSVTSQRELERQTKLLNGVEADLELISRVQIHVEFMSNAVRKAIEGGERHRTLGDYVSHVKMKQVAELCSRTHEDLQVKFDQVELAVKTLKEGTDVVRSSLSKTNLLEDAEACARRSQDIVVKIVDSAAALESGASDLDVVIQELHQLDANHRREVQLITDVKNAYTQQCLTALRQISVLNNDIVQIPPSLAALQASFRGKNSFSHIQRLHNMLCAYGATVIEIVRRKEFSRFFYQRAQSILEVMAKLSASERKRRQVYRGEVHGQLPFEARGMDDPVPTIDFSPSGNSDAAYSFEREDVDGLLRVLEDLERYARSTGDPEALKTVQECKASLDKLVIKMDSLEAGFDRIAERSLLSASRLSLSRRRTIEAEEQAYHELVEELRISREAKARQDAVFQEERNALQSEIHRLKLSLQDVDSSTSTEQDRAARLEREVHQVRAQLEGEITARRIVEERNSELQADIESQRIAIARALADATEQSKAAQRSRQELEQVQSEFDEMKELVSQNESKISVLVEEQARNLRNLEDARARGENLELQIQAAQAESEEVRQVLKATSQEKDRLLKLQATEHDRIIRDHIAEADGDRAVLERQFHELKNYQEGLEREVKNLKADIEVANADAVGLREELQRVEHELREARHVERILRDDLKAGRASQSDFDQRMENGNRLIAQILDVAICFRNSHVKALQTAQAASSHPASKHANTLAESTTFSPGLLRIGQQHDEPSPIDPSDPAAALEILRELDHDVFLEAVAKTGSTIRKWQKQCKEYRERAKGKISFRNFAKGDLAMFLPTRNSVSKPWAAFNVSFPHYFLQATGHLAEQLKTREWIVARITSITERVVNQQDPTSNPYGLGEGVKYYMLEVEDWTQPSGNKRRASGRKTTSEKDSPSSPGSGRLGNKAIPPPELEVQDTHPSNSHLFPVRTRANSSPTARPSSLSRLLAQASVENGAENPTESLPDDEIPPPDLRASSPSPLPSPAVSPPSPPQIIGSLPQHVPGVHSPLRPNSRASRLSSTSRFSVGRIPNLGSVSTGTPKAAPTTALTEDPTASSPTSNDGNPFRSPVTPSPDESISDGLNNIVNGNSSRRRTTSYHIPRTSPLAVGSASTSRGPAFLPARPSLTATATLANLANSWGASFGRKKKAEVAGGSLTTNVEALADDTRTTNDTLVRDMLKRLS